MRDAPWRGVITALTVAGSVLAGCGQQAARPLIVPGSPIKVSTTVRSALDPRTVIERGKTVDPRLISPLVHDLNRLPKLRSISCPANRARPFDYVLFDYAHRQPLNVIVQEGGCRLATTKGIQRTALVPHPGIYADLNRVLRGQHKTRAASGR